MSRPEALSGLIARVRRYGSTPYLPLAVRSEYTYIWTDSAAGPRRTLWVSGDRSFYPDSATIVGAVERDGTIHPPTPADSGAHFKIDGGGATFQVCIPCPVGHIGDAARAVAPTPRPGA